MKHNKLLLGLLSTGIVASAIPALSITSCGCSKPDTPTSEWDVNDSLVYKYNAGYVESSESKQGACYITGFKLSDDFAVSDLSVEVTNLQGMTDTAVEAEIEEIGYNYFSVNVYFTSKNAMVGQNGTFDIVLKNSKGNTKTFTEFKVISFANTMRISFTGKHDQTIATLSDGKNYEFIINGGFHIGTGHIPTNAELQVSFKDYEQQVVSGVSAQIVYITDSTFSIKLTFDDLSTFDLYKIYYLEFTNADYPEWSTKILFTFDIVTKLSEIFKCEYSAESAKLKKCLCTDKEIVVPDKITIDEKDYPITEIEDDNTFSGLPVESLTIGDNVTTIYNSSLSGCISLKSLKIGKNVNLQTGKSSYPLSGSVNIQTITIDPENKHISSANANCIIKNTGTVEEPKFDTLIRGTNKTVIPTENVTTIDKNAFYRLSDITSITIPANITKLGSSCFGRSTNLETVTFEGASQITAIPDSVFQGCASLKNIQLPNTIKSIGETAFADCVLLQNVNMPTSLVELSNFAFNGCVSLTGTITIPATVTKILGNPFAACINLSGLVVDDGNTVYHSKIDGNQCNCIYTTIPSKNINYVYTALKGATIPTNAIIGAYCFNSMVNLTEFDFANVIAVGDLCFSGCIQLQTLKNFNNVLYVGTCAFTDCSSITEVSLPNVLEIGEDAFRNCVSLTKADFTGNTNLTRLLQCTFESCLLLNNVVLPSNLKQMDRACFEKCISLESITLPDTLTTIDRACFENCISLKTVNFTDNSSLTEIGSYAFENTLSLNSITIPASVKSIQPSAFKKAKLTSTIFKDPNNWKTPEGAVDPETLKDPAKAAEVLLEGKTLAHQA